MNSRQYEKMMRAARKFALADAGISEDECTSVVLSADRTEYEVTLTNGSTVIIQSGFDYMED